jgi:transposase
MAKAYSDDLRQRFLSAYQQGEGTLKELAKRFMVSVPYGKKLRGQFLRSGQMERIEQRRGTPRKLLDGPRGHLRGWVTAAPDLTLDQLQEKLRQECGLGISRAQLARVLKRIGLRLKKSHSMPPSGTQKKTSGWKSSSRGLAPSRRRN